MVKLKYSKINLEFSNKVIAKFSKVCYNYSIDKISCSKYNIK